MITCPVCKIEYKVFRKEHLTSKDHLANLKRQGLTPENDPAKIMLEEMAKSKSVPEKKEKKKNKSAEPDADLIRRIERLESAVQSLSETMERVLQHLKLGTIAAHNDDHPVIFTDNNVISAIMTCLKARGTGERWVALDDVVGVLKASSAPTRDSLYRVIEDMFYKDRIDLAEGGNPKYPLRIRGSNFGLIALQA
nr:hypothetical protein [Candidatus Sigynarchaeota archaeon]